MNLKFSARTSAAISVDNTTKTRLAYRAPATHGVKITRVQLSFDGTSPTDPKAVVEIIRGVTSAAGTNSAATLGKVGGHTGNPAGAATQQYTAEPTYTSEVVIVPHYVHTQSGLVLQLEVQLNPSDLFAIRMSSTNVRNMWACIEGEE